MANQFKRTCWGRHLHETNGISQDEVLVHGSKIPMRTLRGMVLESGRMESWKRQKCDRNMPVYCRGCVEFYTDHCPVPIKIQRIHVSSDQTNPASQDASVSAARDRHEDVTTQTEHQSVANDSRPATGTQEIEHGSSQPDQGDIGHIHDRQFEHVAIQPEANDSTIGAQESEHRSSQGDTVQIHDRQFKDAAIQTEGKTVTVGFLGTAACNEVELCVKELDRLTEDQRSFLAFCLGQCERYRVKKTVFGPPNDELRSLESLATISPIRYLEQMNSAVTGFLHGLMTTDAPATASALSTSSVSSDQQGKPPLASLDKPSDIYQLCKVTEACSALTTPVAVLPFHFREVVLIYSLTRSRFALDVLASSSPSGTYTTVRSLFNDETSSVPMPNGDILVCFDNNQVLKKTWRISLKTKFLCHVITMVIAFEITDDGTLQKQLHLKPGSRLGGGNVISEEKISRVKDVDGKGSVARNLWYSTFIYPIVTKYLQEVAEEHTDLDKDGRQATDAVDAKITIDKRLQEYKTCPGCLYQFVPIRARKCSQCGNPVTKEKVSAGSTGETSGITDIPKVRAKSSVKEVRLVVTSSNDKTVKITQENGCPGPSSNSIADDLGVTDRHAGKPGPSVSVMEPVFLNPGSYDALATVFRTIGKKAGVRRYCPEGEREWLAIECDGSPFVIGMRIIQKYFLCSVCKAAVVGHQKCIDHAAEFHPWEEDPTKIHFEREFDWILLLPGPGHIEMNMVKAYVKLTWSVFWESLVEIFNFKSPAAKKVAQNVSDHHKGWTLCTIAFEAIVKELLVPFVRSRPPQLTCEAFFKYMMTEAKDPNYGFLADVTLEILGSILLYRIGVRSGNVELMHAGRALFSKVWVAKHHPMYRELDMYDFFNMELMPDEVRSFTEKTMSINLSGGAFSAEGADFRLEEINKAIQHWIPAVPKNKDWRAACVNYTKIQELRQTTLQQMNLADPKIRSKGQTSDISEEVLAFRTLLRSKEYCLHPSEARRHVSLKGEELADNLEQFSAIAREKRLKFCDSFVAHYNDANSEGPVPYELLPISVTKAELEDTENINKRSINDILLLTKNKLQGLTDVEVKQTLQTEFDALSSGRRAKKQKYVDFFQTVVDAIEMEKIEDMMLSNDSSDE